VPTLRIVGPGRAGSSLADALAGVGWTVLPPLGRGDRVIDAGEGVDLCVIATPDGVIADVAAAIQPRPTTVVAHLAGSLGLDVLEPHPRTAAMHPLASLPSQLIGSAVLRGGVWWAVEGDPLASQVVADLGGRELAIGANRGAYHAAACIAANHLVALMAQVERVAAAAGLPAEPFYDLASGALANARSVGAAAALTGPAARGDIATIGRHLAALDPAEHELYNAGVLACR
jgi:predicted short-subunit dehydrogenase-like oxidoreductase (DUF2520 family)